MSMERQNKTEFYFILFYDKRESKRKREEFVISAQRGEFATSYSLLCDCSVCLIDVVGSGFVVSFNDEKECKSLFWNYFEFVFSSLKT